MDWLKIYVLKWIFKDGLKEIEKQNLILKVMAECWKVPDLKKVWPEYCDGVSGLLQDWESEVAEARKWK